MNIWKKKPNIQKTKYLYKAKKLMAFLLANFLIFILLWLEKTIVKKI